jgi:hypothetical protein
MEKAIDRFLTLLGRLDRQTEIVGRSIAVWHKSQVDIRAGKRAVVQRDEVHVYDVQ